jgi:hypothetical protein
MLLQLFASAADQAIWGLGFAGIVALVVLVPWKRLVSKNSPALTSTAVDAMPGAAERASSPEPSIPDPTPTEPEPDPGPDPTPVEPEPIPGPLADPVPQPALVEVVDEAGVEVVEVVEVVDEAGVGSVEEVDVETEEHEEHEEQATEDETVSVAALDVRRSTNVIRIDIAGPKPDGAYDIVPHHHH